MTEREKIKARLIVLFKKYSREKNLWDTATEESKIFEDLKLNSARMVDVVLDLEEEYGFEVDDDEMDSVVTIGDAIDMVIDSLKAK